MALSRKRIAYDRAAEIAQPGEQYRSAIGWALGPPGPWLLPGCFLAALFVEWAVSASVPFLAIVVAATIVILVQRNRALVLTTQRVLVFESTKLTNRAKRCIAEYRVAEVRVLTWRRRMWGVLRLETPAGPRRFYVSIVYRADGDEFVAALGSNEAPTLA